MSDGTVLIVEDDILIALDVEQALVSAGYEVCGVAASEGEALALGRRCRPAFAVVDISLGPGDGRAVASALAHRYDTAVLFATGQCNDVRALAGSGAKGCLPKPYQADDVPAALAAVARLCHGDEPGPLPDKMFVLG